MYSRSRKGETAETEEALAEEVEEVEEVVVAVVVVEEDDGQVIVMIAKMPLQSRQRLARVPKERRENGPLSLMVVLTLESGTSLSRPSRE